MDEAYQRDYDHKRLCDEARRALEAVLDSRPLRKDRRALIDEARNALVNESNQVVRAWD